MRLSTATLLEVHTSRRTARLLVLLFTCAALTAGCSDANSSKRGSVWGTVKLDGKPIERGAITFRPAPGTKGPTAGATIEHGEYAVDRRTGPPIGDLIVEFHASYKTGRRVEDRFGVGMIDETLEMFPKNLNDSSTIMRKIEAGKNELNFDLSSSGENE